VQLLVAGEYAAIEQGEATFFGNKLFMGLLPKEALLAIFGAFVLLSEY
jgi:hypothetical protein